MPLADRTGAEVPAVRKRQGAGALPGTLFLAALMLVSLVGGPLAADVTITRLANEGVIVSDGRLRIMIDGMVVEPYSLYGGLPDKAALAFDRATGAFAGIDLALASHRHHDHNQPRFACRFLQASPGTEFKSSPQVIGLMREKCREFVLTSPRVHQIEPQYGVPHVTELDGARVSAFLLSHGVRKYARLQNYGHLVELGGVTVVHLGDAAMGPEDFARAGLDTVDIDVALIPFWFFQPGAGAALIERFLDAPLKIAVHIPPREMAETREHLAAEFPTVVVLAQPLDELTVGTRAAPVR
ncbi:MAG: MBL fold metallo-hydrolase [Xanthomonadales bacterium]|nr:MBL fold metallo-hydrolase [Xanthomonadales bacterium]